MKSLRPPILLALASIVLASGPAVADEPRRNVLFVTADGLRWQDVFRGADEALLNKEDGGVVDVDEIRREFWRPTPEARREAMMPFLWSVVAKQGQIYGNADKGSRARVTNGKNFSYPGYNEMFTGSADPKVDSNSKKYNANSTVLEWLNERPACRDKVRAVGSWDLYPFILNQPRSRLPINAGWVPFASPVPDQGQDLLNRLIGQAPRIWDDCRDDAFTFEVALRDFRAHRPRVFYIGLGDTDEHAHTGRYDKYLRAARDTDENIARLWAEVQADPEYRGTTSLVFTTDHGRGDPPKGWRDHGAKVAGAEAIWIAVLGPDTRPLGERTQAEPVTQSQVAATVAALAGEKSFNAEVPAAAPPIADAIRP